MGAHRLEGRGRRDLQQVFSTTGWPRQRPRLLASVQKTTWLVCLVSTAAPLATDAAKRAAGMILASILNRLYD